MKSWNNSSKNIMLATHTKKVHNIQKADINQMRNKISDIIISNNLEVYKISNNSYYLIIFSQFIHIIYLYSTFNIVIINII